MIQNASSLYPKGARLILGYVHFRFRRLRFHFEAVETVWIPLGQSGNVVRGAFGNMLRKVACTPLCGSDGHSGHAAGCAYARIFEPRSPPGEGPSGFSDRPRPFVFRTAHLDAREIPPGESFRFDAHLFDVTPAALSYFVSALGQLAEEGLGPRRARAKLVSVEQHPPGDSPPAIAFDSEKLYDGLEPSAISLDPESAAVSSVTVRFKTPTELKSGDGLAIRPDFPILFARIRDRISTLRALYGEGPLDVDFRAMGARAATIEMPRCEIHQERAERHSTRTGQTHPLGGFTGLAEYRGDLTEFVPYLRAARWTGVGRQTVWGKGEICVNISGRREVN